MQNVCPRRWPLVCPLVFLFRAVLRRRLGDHDAPDPILLCPSGTGAVAHGTHGAAPDACYAAIAVTRCKSFTACRRCPTHAACSQWCGAPVYVDKRDLPNATSRWAHCGIQHPHLSHREQPSCARLAPRRQSVPVCRATSRPDSPPPFRRVVSRRPTCPLPPIVSLFLLAD